MVDLKNQPTLTQFIRTTNEKKEDAAKKIAKKEEREDKKEETGTMEDGQEDKEDNTEEEGRPGGKKIAKIETSIDAETTQVQENPEPLKQIQEGRKTPVNSVQLKIRAFTTKFNLPPKDKKPPQENFSISVPPTTNRRRPRQNIDNAQEHQLSGEGKTSGKYVTCDGIGEIEGMGGNL